MALVTNPRKLEPQIISVQPVSQPGPQSVILMSLPPPPKDYLVLSIISFLFFILLAVPALWFSLKTREANFFGDQRKAQRNSRLALAFSVSSILVGSIGYISSAVIRVLWRKM